MATVQQVTGDLAVIGALSVTSGITGQRRSGITADNSQAYPVPVTGFRIWDDFARSLPDTSSTSGLHVASFAWDPNIADSTFFVSNREFRVVGITARVEVTGTDGSAVTAAIKKAPSGTDIAAGTALHSSTINLKGTVDTNQSLTLSTTATDLNIASGDSIGLDLTGTPTSARGVVSVYLVPLSPDDLSITSGAFATGLPYISTGDVKSLGTVTRYARSTFTLPPEYQAGATAQIRVAAGMLTTVAATSATVTIEAYKSNRDTTKTGSNLVTTLATSINSLTFANKTFDLNAAGLAAGDVLDIRITVTTVDGATGTAVIAAIAHAEVLLTIQG